LGVGVGGGVVGVGGDGEVVGRGEKRMGEGECKFFFSKKNHPALRPKSSGTLVENRLRML
jgi:hypothetical protein